MEEVWVKYLFFFANLAYHCGKPADRCWSLLFNQAVDVEAVLFHSFPF